MTTAKKSVFALFMTSNKKYFDISKVSRHHSVFATVTVENSICWVILALRKNDVFH